MNPALNLIIISADTQGKVIYPVEPGAATTVKAKAGEHYRVVFYRDGKEHLLDDVIAVYRNGDLVLMYADGTEVVLENYVEACQGNACRVSLPKGKVGMESDGEEEAYELSGNENGTVLSNHDVMVYAHGDQNALMSRVAHDKAATAAIASYAQAESSWVFWGSKDTPAALAGDGGNDDSSMAAMLALLGGELIARTNTQSAQSAAPPPQSVTPSDSVLLGAVVSDSELSSGADYFDNNQSIELGKTPITNDDDYAVGAVALAARRVAFLRPVDTTPPAAATMDLALDTGFDTNDRITSYNLILVSGVEAGAIWEYSADYGATWSLGGARGGSFTVADESYAAGQVRVRVSDVAGNTNVIDNFAAFTVDRVAPDPLTVKLVADTGRSSSDGVTKDGRLSISGLETGTVYQVSTDGGVSWSARATDPIYTLAEGAYTSLLVHHIDGAGNFSFTYPGMMVVDTTDPALATLALAADTGVDGDRITNNNLINVTGIETGAIWEYSVDSGANWLPEPALVIGGFSVASGFYAAGQVQVRVSDVAGNRIVTDNFDAFTVDRGAPDQLTVALVADTGSSSSDRVTRDGRLSISGLESGAFYQIHTSANGETTVSQPTTDPIYTLGEGTYASMLVSHTDLAGNRAIFSLGAITVDTTPPALATLALAVDTGVDDDRVTSNHQINVTGIETGATWEYSVNSGANWSPGNTVDATGSSFFTVADGSYVAGEVRVRVSDVAGNRTVSDSFAAFTVDKVAVGQFTVRLVDDTGISDTDGITKDGRLLISGLESGAVYQVRTNTGVSWSSWSAESTSENYTLAAGVYTEVEIRQIVGGDVGHATVFNLGAITVDTTPPALATMALFQDTGPLGSNNNDRITADNLILVGGIETGATWEYSVDSGATWSTGGAYDGSFTVADGSYAAGEVRVRVSDVAGNRAVSDNFASFTVDTVAPDELTIRLVADTGNNSSDAVTKDGRLSISGLETGAIYQVSTDGGADWSANATDPIYTLNPGAYTNVQVRHIDIAGNSSLASRGAITVDTTAPAAATMDLALDTGFNTNDRITSYNLILVSGIEMGAIWEYSADYGATWSLGGARNGSFTVADESYAAGQVRVRVIDAAGNTALTDNFAAFTVDRVAPDPLTVKLVDDTGVSSSDGVTKDGRLSISGLETGTVYQVSTDSGASWSARATDPIYTLAEGTYYTSVLVRHMDGAGNSSITYLGMMVVDTTAPALATLALAADTGVDGDRITNNNLINVTGIETGAIWEYSVDSGANWLPEPALVIGGFSVASGFYAAGQVQVRVSDVAGNRIVTDNFDAFTVDRGAPGLLTVALVADTGSSSSDRVTKDGKLSISGLESGAFYQIHTSANGETTVSQPTTDPIYTLGEGTYASMLVSHTDLAGNRAIFSLGAITVDTTAPALATLALAVDTGVDDDRVTSNHQINVTGIETGATWEYSVNSGANWSPGNTVDATGSSFFTVADGSYAAGEVRVRVSDVAGNRTVSDSFAAFTVGKVAPDRLTVKLVADTGVSSSDGVTKDGRLSIAGLESGAVYQVRTNTGVSWSSWSAESTSENYTLAAGVYTEVEIRQIVGGDVGHATVFNLGAITVDTTDPAAATLALARDTGIDGVDNNDRVTSNQQINVTGIETGATWEYSVNSGANWSPGNTVDVNGSSFFTVADGSYAAGEVRVRVSDVAGNRTVADNFAAFTVDTTAPALATLALAADTGVDGDRVTSNQQINVTGIETGATWEYSVNSGANWSPGNTVDVNGSSFFTVADRSYAAGEVRVRVSDVAGNRTVSDSFAAFTVDKVAPDRLTVKLVADTGVSSSDGVTKDGRLSIAGLESGAVYQVSTDGGNTWSENATDPIYSLAEGTYTEVLVRHIDLAGNRPITSVGTITVDTTDPAAATLALARDTGIDGVDNNDRVTSNQQINVTDIEMGATWEYSVNSGANWSTGGSVNTDGSSFFTVADGSYAAGEVRVRVSDVAGNRTVADNFAAFTVDTTAPALATLALAADTGVDGDRVTSNHQINVTGIETGATWEYSVNSGANWSPGNTVDVNGSSFFTVADRSYAAGEVRVRVSDVAGNRTVSDSFAAFTVDKVAPDRLTVKLVADTGVSSSDGVTKDGRLSIAGLESGAVYQVSTDGGNTWSENATDPIYSLAEGTYTEVLVRHIDLAGNRPITSVGTIMVDTTDPAAATLALARDTGIDGVDNNDRVTSNQQINVTGIETGATWEYSVNSGANWSPGNTVEANGSSFFTVADRSYAAGEVRVRVSDVAGNRTVSDSFAAFTVDKVAPDRLTVKLVADTGVSSSDGVTKDGRLSIAGLESGAVYQVSTDGGNTWSENATDPIYSLAEGTYTEVLVRHIDLAGNRPITSVGTITVDTTDPAAATLALARDTGIDGVDNNDRVTSNQQINVTGIETGATWEYSVNSGANWSPGNTVDVNGSSFFTVADGSYAAGEVRVRVSDVAGNRTVSDNFAAFTVDTTAPALATLALAADTGVDGDRVTSNQQINVTGIETGATWEYSVNSGANWSPGNTVDVNGSSFFTVADRSYAAGEVRVRVSDVAGNRTVSDSFAAFTVDKVAPDRLTVKLVADTGVSSSDGVTKDGRLSIAGLESGAVYQVSTDGGNTWSANATDPIYSLAEGTYTEVLVRHIDLAGNRPITSVGTIMVDTTDPAAATLALARDTGIDGVDNNDRVTSNQQINVTGIETGATWEYSVNSGANWSTGGSVNTDGSSFFTVADGSYAAGEVRVRVSDVAGNRTVADNFAAFTVDTTAPALATLALAADTGVDGDRVTSNHQINVTGIETGATWEYSVNSGANWSPGNTVDVNGSSFFTVADRSYAAGEVRVRVSDVAGNRTVSDSFAAFTVDKVAPDRLTVKLVADTGVSSSDGVTKDGRLSIAGLESGAVYQVSTDGGNTWSANATDPIYSLAEGTYTEVLVRHIDLAGNRPITSVGTITVDTTDPAAATLALARDTGIDGVDNNDRVTSNHQINVTGIETGATWEYSVNSGANWSTGGSVNTDGSSFFTVADGSYAAGEVRVRVSDVAGNRTVADNFAAFTVEPSAVDRLTGKLATDTGISDADGITKDGRLLISGLESGAVYQVSTNGGNTWSQTTTDLTYTLAEGTYTNVLARHIDLTGNHSITSLGAITVDTTAPALATLALAADTGVDGDRITKNNQINVTGIETGATWEYSVDSGVNWLTGNLVAIDGSSFFTVADRSYAAGEVRVHVIDVAGNRTVSDSFTAFTVDTVAPNRLTVKLVADTGSSSFDHVTKDGRLSISGLESGAFYQIHTSANGETTVSQPTTDPIYTLGEGTYASMLVSHTDLAGNQAIFSLGAITVDTTPALATLALAADTGVDGDRVTSNHQINVTGIETGATWEYSTDYGATWSFGGARNGSFTVADESYAAGQVRVRVIDVAGNTALTDNFAAFTVDRVAPDRLTVKLVDDTGVSSSDGVTKDGRLSISGLETGTVYQVSTDSGASWSARATDPIYTLAEGTYYTSVLVRHMDGAGNSSITYLGMMVVDTTAPALATLALAADTDGANDRVTSNNQINVTGIETGATWEYSVDSGVNWLTGNLVAIDGSSFFTVADRSYAAGEVRVHVIDVAGNIAVSDNFAAFTVDLSAVGRLTVELAADTGISDTDGITKDGRLLISGLETGAVYQVSTDGGNTWSQTTTDLTYTLAEGTYTEVLARHIDLTGNHSITSVGAITVDTTAPALATMALAADTDVANDRITANNFIVVHGIEKGATWQYSRAGGGTSWLPGNPVDADGSSYFIIPDGSYATGQVQVRVFDAAGNTTVTDNFAAFTMDPSADGRFAAILVADTGISDTDGITKDGSLFIRGLGSDAVYQVRANTEGGFSTWSADNTSQNYTLAPGVYTDVELRKIIDGDVGNATVISLGAITVDITPPAKATVELELDTGFNTNDRTDAYFDRITAFKFITVRGIETGATWEYSVDSGANWSPGREVFSDGTSFFDVADGVYDNGEVQVRVIDVAGNVSAPTTDFAAFTLDTVAPERIYIDFLDTGSSGSDRVTNDGRLFIDGLEDADAAYLIAANGEELFSGGINDLVYTLAEGTYTNVQAYHYDLAGNSTRSYQGDIIVDTTPPAAATMTLYYDSGLDNNDRITAYPSIIVTGIERAETTGISWTGGYWDYSVDYGVKWSFGGKRSTGSFSVAEGSYADGQVRVRAFDAAGNSKITDNFAAFTVDRSAFRPLTVTLVADTGISSSDRVTKDGRLLISDFEFRVAYQVRTSTEGVFSTWSHFYFQDDPYYTLAPGVYTDVEIRQAYNDNLGEITTITSLGAITVDITAPALATMALAADTDDANDRVTSNNQINVTGIETGATWEYSTDSGVNWSPGNPVAADGSSFFTVTDGSYAAGQVQVRVVDRAGNRTSITDFVSFEVDTTDLLFTAATFDVEENSTMVGQLLASENVSWAIVTNDADQYTIDPSTGILTLNTVKDYEAGDVVDRIQVSATDAAGNSITQAVTIRLLDVNEAPTINSNNLVSNQSITAADASTWSFAIPRNAFIDPEGASLSYSSTGITPSGGATATDIVFDDVTDTFRFSDAVTPAAGYSYSIALSISDGVNTASHTFSVAVL